MADTKKTTKKTTKKPAKKIEPANEYYIMKGVHYKLERLEGDLAIMKDPEGVVHVFARKDFKL